MKLTPKQRLATPFAALLASVLLASSASGQTLLSYTWQDTGTGDWAGTGANYNWDDPGAFGGDPTPEGRFNENAFINNGGTAQVSTVFDNSGTGKFGPGGLTVTNDSVLEILNGGVLTSDPSGADVAGNIAAGSGTAIGSIIVNPGGELVINGNLNIFGNFNSSLTLSGDASVTSTGTANLQRMLSITGPDVSLNADIINFGGSTVYNATVVGGSHSVLTATTEIQLDNILNVDLSGATGSSWDLFEAPSIKGGMDQVNVTGVSFLPGEFATLETNDVGGGLMRASLVFDSVLYAEVDTDTGAITIKKSGSETVDIDGYSLSSSLEALNAGYTSPFDQAIGDWIEVSSSNSQLVGVEIDGSSSINDSSSLSLPNAFSPKSAPLGTSLADIEFTYATTSGDLVEGDVIYVGDGVSSLSNDMVLIVDADGNAQMQNASGTPVAIEGYVIETEDGTIDTAGWLSLNGQGIEGWLEATESANLLAEVDLNDVINLATRSGFNLGDLFSGEIPSDLEFSYVLEGDSEATPGTVLFIDNVSLADLEGDFNGDGTVDVADYTVWRDNLNSSEASLTAGGNGDGIVDTLDYERWRANFGATAITTGFGAATAAPEPSAIVLMLAACGALAYGRRS